MIIEQTTYELLMKEIEKLELKLENLEYALESLQDRYDNDVRMRSESGY